MNDHKEIIEKHQQLYNLAVNHQYLPNGSNGAMVELNEVYKAKVGQKIDTHCPSCIINALKYLFEAYLPTLQEPQVIELKTKKRK
jgi:hypothetical protein